MKNVSDEKILEIAKDLVVARIESSKPNSFIGSNTITKMLKEIYDAIKQMD